jgi:SpoVK/Ycf46/Vps4 family AAA+-type ATPase
MPLQEGFELSDFVPELLGSSGADLVFVAKEAAITALRRSVDVDGIIKDNAGGGFKLTDITVGKEDFEHALEELSINKVRNGREKAVSER